MQQLRDQMLDEMKLSGLSKGTQIAYIKAVMGLAKYYNRTPEFLTENEVRDYLLYLKNKNVARGTFKTAYFGIQFLYENTLNRQWPLFLKKRFACLNKNAFQPILTMPMYLPC